MHVELRYVHAFSRTYFRYDLHSASKIFSRIIRADINCLQPGDFIGVSRFIFFRKVIISMRNYFEMLVRANFRFGRMCGFAFTER